MNTAVRIALGLLATAPVHAASPAAPPAPASKVAAALAARTAAAEAFKQGNAGAAIARLQAAASRSPRAPAADVQVISQLCSLARELEAAVPGSGRTAALAAVAEGQRTKVRLSRRDSALVETQLGALHERTLGNPASARTHYQAALALDPSIRDARLGLARLAWRDALIETKARENDALRRRSK
jgi:hypothetical protein